MNGRLERQRNIRKLSGEQVLKEREALKSKVQSGQAKSEEKTKLKELEKRAARMLKDVENVI